jgi:hypothetical protein
MPFLLLLLLGATDFCRIYYYAQTVQSCARSGALFACGAAVGPSSMTPAAAAQKAALAEGASLDPALQADNVVLTSDSTNNTVTVTITYSFRTVISYPGIPSSASIVKQATMPVLVKS